MLEVTQLPPLEVIDPLWLPSALLAKMNMCTQYKMSCKIILHCCRGFAHDCVL